MKVVNDKEYFAFYLSLSHRHLTLIFNFYFFHSTIRTCVQLEPLIVQAYNDSITQAKHNESHANHTQNTHHTRSTQHTQHTQDIEKERGRSTEHPSITSLPPHRLSTTPPSHTTRSRPRSLSQTPRERTDMDSSELPLKFSPKEPDLNIPHPLIRSNSSISDSTGRKRRMAENMITVENTEKSRFTNNLNVGVKYHHRHAHRTHGHHSQTNCLFFVDPCTSLELMSPTADEPTQGLIQGIPVQVPQAVIPSESSYILYSFFRLFIRSFVYLFIMFVEVDFWCQYF